MTTIHVTETPSPVGPLTLAATDRGLRAVVMSDLDGARPALEGPPDDVRACAASDHPVLAAAVDQLAAYFAGERDGFDIELDPVGTPFQLEAWTALRAIPYGETISYGEQAARMGDPRKARAVGAANGKNPLPIVVPCHRVVGADGSLTGYAGGVETKAWLLDHERAASGRSLALG